MEESTTSSKIAYETNTHKYLVISQSPLYPEYSDEREAKLLREFSDKREAINFVKSITQHPSSTASRHYCIIDTQHEAL